MNLGKLDNPLLFVLGVLLVVFGGKNLLSYGTGKLGLAGAHDAITA